MKTEQKLSLPPRNVLNSQEVVDLLVKKCKNKDYPTHVKKWVTTILERWFMKSFSEVKRVIDYTELNRPWFIVADLQSSESGVSLRARLEDECLLVNLANQPDWVKKAISEGQELVYIDPAAIEKAFTDEFDHAIDYLRTLPEKGLSQTVYVVRRDVERWDKALAKQKLLGSLSDGVKLIETDAFESLDSAIVLVRLITSEAFKNEGAIMKHCVGSYAERANTEVYSVRSSASATPLATFEVLTTKRGKDRVLVQLKGPRNSAVSSEVEQCVKDWCTASGVVLRPKKNVPDFDDEYDEEDD